ncbi:MAG: DUF5702 domain-containing protein [Blautia sp.]
MKIRGSMTITMCLLLSVLLSLLFSCVRLARIQYGRVQAVHAVDTGMYSIFAEYDKTLLNNYDLFYLDAGYGNTEINPFRIINQMENSMHTSLTTGLTPCTLQSCAITGYRLASDEDARSFRGQVARSVKNSLGENGITYLENFIRQSLSLSDSQQQQKEQGPSPVESDSIKSEENLPEITEHTNPLEVFRRLKDMGILGLVLPSDCSVSEKNIPISDLPSHRKLQKGMGYLETGNSENQKLYMQSYIMDKLGNYASPRSSDTFAYEAEYILWGQSSDKENLRKTVNRLLLMRETANCVSLYTDPVKRQETLAMATSLCTLLLFPQGTAAAEALLLAGWAYAESLVDVRQLMLGGKVPLVKTADSWQTRLSSIGDIFALLQSDQLIYSSGLNYRDYLHLMLFTVSEQTQTFRCMDMIEQNIRSLPGKKNFSIDCCLESLETETVIGGPEGITWTALRSYGYDM